MDKFSSLNIQVFPFPMSWKYLQECRIKCDFRYKIETIYWSFSNSEFLTLYCVIKKKYMHINTL